MTIEQLKDQIEAKLILNDVFVGGEEYIPHVASLTYESNYIQILFDYGIDALLVVLEVLETNENYEQCAVIKQVIENTNKIEGTSFATKYKINE